jgi:hypothetical protein
MITHQDVELAAFSTSAFTAAIAGSEISTDIF